MTLQRYDLLKRVTGFAEIVPVDEGQYVLYADALALQSAIDYLTYENEQLTKMPFGADLISRLLNMVERVEWVKRAGGKGYCCPFCGAISERDGGPGHTEECEWMAIIHEGEVLRQTGLLP